MLAHFPLTAGPRSSGRRLLARIAGGATLAAMALASGLATAIPAAAQAGPVKQSTSGLCHCPGGSYYARTTTFSDYPTLDACLSNGGREPRVGQGTCPGVASASTSARMTIGATHAVRGYDRDLFGGWDDADGDCRNTRHELLAELSTGPVHYSDDGCRVIHGRWNDPYTGMIFTSSRNMDVDHLVPLKYAWDRGADTWPRAKRERLANDPVNLFAVDAGANRSKGARGPLEWLPPNDGFACQYILRFQRVAAGYGLAIPTAERRRMADLRKRVCD